MSNLVDIMNELDYMALHMVEVGILGIDGDLKGDNSKTTILEYAVYNEFGTKHIPPRPFMRNAIESNSQAISNYIEARVNDILEGQITGRKALMQIGEYIRGLIIQSIATATNWAEPLSPKTLKAKLKEGSNNDKTLIEDRFLIKSIRYQITSKTGKIVYLSNFKEV
ncbi:MAG: HK97-gp10 family putative phage morphogenesis protein [Fusobacterium sp.]|uniref:HK97-gp10 family putative phage morphogenesis protein n=1 Tax=Fusobacterium sp. TaxID=68766 RepID=UPI00399A5813